MCPKYRKILLMDPLKIYEIYLITFISSAYMLLINIEGVNN